MTRRLLAAFSVATVGCAPGSALDPAGPAAGRIAELWWLVFGLGTTVFVAVLALLSVPLWRARRRGSRSPGGPRPAGADHDAPTTRRLVLLGGVVVPALVIVAVVVAGFRVSSSVSHVARDGELLIDVTGHQFWWEVSYPELEFVTANEIHVPTGRPVRLRLRSADVIHSFWVPSLHGKVDLRPGAVTSLAFEADRAGTYRGQCAEYCGLAHAQMAVLVVAQDPADFQRWAAGQAGDAHQPDSDRAEQGREVFRASSCNECHAVRGHTTPATTTTVAPDLTHLATRRTLAAGMLVNDEERLAAWITDPHRFKPGAAMPPTRLEDADLDALLAYLEGLR